MQKKIPQMEPWFGSEEADAVHHYIMAGGWGTEFEKTREFERRLSEFTGARHVIATTSGTVSLYLALSVLGIGPGDEVLIPDLTMIATANAAKMLGATPVFVDVEPRSLCMCPEDLRKKTTSRAKAVVYVEFNGRAGELTGVRQFAREKGLLFVEDAAQALGSFHQGRHLGTFGEIGCLSFSSPKIISTGQGGALMTNSDSLADSIRKQKDFGRAKGGVDVHDEVAGNFKFTDFQAVVGVEQMKKLPERVKRKRALYARYQERLGGMPGVELLPTNLGETSPWFIDVFVDRREELMAHLQSAGVGTRVIYPPLHSQKAYAQTGVFPVTESYSRRGVWLPSSLKLTDHDVDFVCDQIERFFQR